MPINPEAMELLKSMNPEEQKEALSFLSDSERNEFRLALDPSKVIKGSAVDTVLQGTFSKSVPFYNQIGAAVGAAGEEILERIQGTDDKTLKERYTKNLNTIRNLQKTSEEESKNAAALGKTLGTIGQFAGSAVGGLPVGYFQAASDATSDPNKTPEEMTTDFGIAAGLMTAIAAAPLAFKGGKSLVQRLRKSAEVGDEEALKKATNELVRKYTDTERLGRIVGASAPEKLAIEESAAALDDVLFNKNIIKSGFEGTKKIAARTELAKDGVGKQLGTYYDDIQNAVGNTKSVKNIRGEEIAHRVTKMADDVDAMADVGLKRAILKEADELKAMKPKNIKEMWKERMAYDHKAYKYNSLEKPTYDDTISAKVAQKVRDAMQSSINERAAMVLPKSSYKAFEQTNKEFATLSKLHNLVGKGKYKSSGSLLDKMTIGAAMVSAKNPGIAVPFFAGREFVRKVSPTLASKMKHTKPNSNYMRLFYPLTLNNE